MILKTKSLQHQTQAYNHIQDLDYFALYMDMGTGKTRTIFEYIKQKGIKKVIYFCPVSLKYTVRNEIIKHIKDPSYEIIDKQKKLKVRKFYIIGIESINSARIYILLYNLFKKINKKNTIVIIDEASYCKNIFAKRTKKIIQLSLGIKYKCIMTGTALTNNYQDLFSHFYFLNRNILMYRSYYSFVDRYLIYHSKYRNMIIGTKNIDELMNNIKPYIFQIKKEDCLDLPEKIFKYRYFNMTKEQRDKYEYRKELFFDTIAEIENLDWISIEIFKLFNDLQKIVCEYDNRLNCCLNILEEIQNDKIIIFCKYLKDIDKLKERIKRDIFIYIGAVKLEDREKIINDFSQSKNGVLLITYGVGGFGLNLSFLNYCVFYNSLFKYENRLQAEDRLYRIGQNKNCIYFDIICNDSIDEKINSNLNLKGYLLKDFIKKIKELQDKEDIIQLCKNHL